MKLLLDVLFTSGLALFFIARVFIKHFSIEDERLSNIGISASED
jgi:hypothetical protein